MFQENNEVSNSKQIKKKQDYFVKKLSLSLVKIIAT